MKRSRWHFFVDRGSELLAAVLTLVAAVLGVWGARLNNENDELAGKVDNLQDAGHVLEDDNASLTDDLMAMTASRDSWKRRAEAAEKNPGDDTTPTTAPDPNNTDPGRETPEGAGIFRQTGSQPVTFAASYGIDLDTRDTNWAVNTNSGDVFLYRSGTDYELSTGTIALVDHEATYDECESQTVLQSGIDKEQLVVGRQFCTRTNEDRWAYVNVRGLDTERGTITLDIVVWTLQTD